MVRYGGTGDCDSVVVAAGVCRLSRAGANIDVVSFVSFRHLVGSTDHGVAVLICCLARNSFNLTRCTSTLCAGPHSLEF